MLEINAMGDSPVSVDKPTKTKPKSVRPIPVTPKPVKPIKAHGGGTTKHCIRCTKPITAETGVVRKLCSACDLTLQEMHWQTEYVLFRKVTYMPEHPDLEGSAKWFEDNGYSSVMRKPPQPYRRSFFRHQPAATLLC